MVTVVVLVSLLNTPTPPPHLHWYITESSIGGNTQELHQKVSDRLSVRQQRFSERPMSADEEVWVVDSEAVALAEEDVVGMTLVEAVVAVVVGVEAEVALEEDQEEAMEDQEAVNHEHPTVHPQASTDHAEECTTDLQITCHATSRHLSRSPLLSISLSLLFVPHNSGVDSS